MNPGIAIVVVIDLYYGSEIIGMYERSNSQTDNDLLFCEITYSHMVNKDTKVELSRCRLQESNQLLRLMGPPSFRKTKPAESGRRESNPCYKGGNLVLCH